MLNTNSSTGVATVGPGGGVTVTSLSMPTTASTISSSCSTSSSTGAPSNVQQQRDRERLRERARNQRLRDTQVCSAVGQTLFTDSPIKHAPGDEVSNKIKSTLGDFGEFANLMSRLNQNDQQHLPMYGISTRDLNKQKVEAIFSEMKTPIEPITGLEDVEFPSSLEVAASGSTSGASRFTPPMSTSITTTTPTCIATIRHTQPIISSLNSSTAPLRASSSVAAPPSSKLPNVNNAITYHSINDTQSRKLALPYHNLIAAVSPPVLSNSPSTHSSRPNVIEDLDLSEDEEEEDEPKDAMNDDKVIKSAGDRKRKADKSSGEEENDDASSSDSSSSQSSSSSDSEEDSDSSEGNSSEADETSGTKKSKKKANGPVTTIVIENGKTNKLTGLSSDDDDDKNEVADSNKSRANKKLRKEPSTSPMFGGGEKDSDVWDLDRFIEGTENTAASKRKAEKANKHRRHSSDMEEGELEEDEEFSMRRTRDNDHRNERPPPVIDSASFLEAVRQTKKTPLLPLPPSTSLATVRRSPIPQFSSKSGGTPHLNRTSTPPPTASPANFQSTVRARSVTNSTIRPHSSNAQIMDSPTVNSNTNNHKATTLSDRTNQKKEDEDDEENDDNDIEENNNTGNGQVLWKDTIGGSVKMRHKSAPIGVTPSKDQNGSSGNKFKSIREPTEGKSKKSTPSSKSPRGSKKSSKGLLSGSRNTTMATPKNCENDSNFEAKVKLSKIVRLPKSLASKENSENKVKSDKFKRLFPDNEVLSGGIKSPKVKLEPKINVKGVQKLTNGKSRKSDSPVASDKGDKTPQGKVSKEVRSNSPSFSEQMIKQMISASTGSASKSKKEMHSINNLGSIPKKTKAPTELIPRGTSSSAVTASPTASSSSGVQRPATLALKAPSPLVPSMTRSPQLSSSSSSSHAHQNEIDQVTRAKQLKRNADRETDRHHQMALYIEAVLYFINWGVMLEIKRSDSEVEKAFHMYKDTLTLLKQITNKFTKSPIRPATEAQQQLDVKLTTLSHICQSLLLLKLNRMKNKELHDNREVITNFLSDSKVQGLMAQASSSVTVSVPSLTMHAISKQLAYLQQYQSALELWIKSEPGLRDHFQLIDSKVTPLSISSPLDHLVEYGLKAIRGMGTVGGSGSSSNPSQ